MTLPVDKQGLGKTSKLQPAYRINPGPGASVHSSRETNSGWGRAGVCSFLSKTLAGPGMGVFFPRENNTHKLGWGGGAVFLGETNSGMGGRGETNPGPARDKRRTPRQGFVWTKRNKLRPCWLLVPWRERNSPTGFGVEARGKIL